MNREYWDSLAASYESDLLEIACGEGGGILEEEVESLACSGGRVADLGCGPGSLLPLLCERFEVVYAVDYSEELLEVARQRCASNRVRYQCHDLGLGRALPFEAELVCCINALIDPRRRKVSGMLRSVTRAVSKEGQLLVVVPAFESFFHVYHTLRRIRRREGKPAGLNASRGDRELRAEVDSFVDGIVRVGGVATKYWMREELLGALAEHGFRARRVRQLHYGWDEEIEHPPGWIGSAGPWDWLVVAERI